MNTKKVKEKLVKEILKEELNNRTEQELIDFLLDNSYVVDVDKSDDETKTRGDVIADKVSKYLGSWPFLIGFIIFLILWIILNIYAFENVDPYPFILLNLVLSCIASLQAPIIMMSQNRQAKKDSLRSRNDYKTDLKSELILEELHDKITAIEKNQKKILEFIESNNTEKKN